MTLDDVTAAVHAWFNERLACPPLAYDTPAYNQVLEAKDDLIVRLSALSPASADPQPQAAPQPEPAPAAVPAAAEKE